MKKYEKLYEDVFSDKKRECLVERKFVKNVNNLTWFNDLLGEYSSFLFDFIIKYEWMKSRSNEKSKFVSANSDFSFYCRSLCNFENKIFPSDLSRIVKSYIPDFFPRFFSDSPFDYKFPYKHNTLSMLLPVYKMEKYRMELLDICEKERFSYSEFLDYIINFISCYNYELGKTYYVLDCKAHIPYVRKW